MVIIYQIIRTVKLKWLLMNELVCSNCRVLVLDSGSIVEFDSPANLLSRDGLFKKLAQDARLA